MIITVQIDTNTPTVTQHREIEIATILRSIADDIEDGRTREDHLTDSRGHHVGHWTSDPLGTPNLTGEELVSTYIAWLDQAWATNPAYIREAYTRSGLTVTDAASFHEAVITDTEGVHPSQWAFHDDFARHLTVEGLYSTQTATEMTAQAPQSA